MAASSIYREDSNDPAVQAAMADSVDLLLKLSPMRKSCARTGRTDVVDVLNLTQFSVLWNLDLRALLEEIQSRKHGWKKKLAARYLALMIYECLEDLPELMGKRLRLALDAHPRRAELGPRARELAKELSLMKKAHGVTLKHVRSIIGAHRHLDAQEQIETLQSFKAKRIEALGYDFLRWNSRLFEFLNEIVQGWVLEGLSNKR